MRFLPAVFLFWFFLIPCQYAEAAENYYYSGHSCQGGSGEPLWYTGRSASSRESSSTVTPPGTWVTCPLDWNQSASLFSATRVYYRDRASAATPSSSYDSYFYCYGWVTDNDGDSFYGGIRYTCSTPGGCTGNTEPSYISPAGVATYLDIPGPGTVSAAASYVQTCHIAGKDAGLLDEYSHLVSYETIF